MKNGKSIPAFKCSSCYVCDSPYVQIHHIIYGTANRQISDKYGYVIGLCQEHHTGRQGVHFNKQLDMQLKRMAQEHFEANYGTREDFIKTFGKSFI